MIRPVPNALLLLLALVAGGCDRAAESSPTDAAPGPADPPAAAPEPEPEPETPAPAAPTIPTASSASAGAPSDLRLFVFDCGRIRLPSIAEFGLPEEATDVRELIVPCYLIDHPEGRLLWDGGLPPAYAGGEWVPDESGAEHFLSAPISEQLSVLDLTPDDVDKVAFSHFHYDHSGDANAFAGSELLIQHTEHAAAFGDEAGAAYFVPELYDELAATPTTILRGDHDVFGDGRVRILSAAGHTPGHQVLWVELADTGPVLLSGDLYHFRVSRARRAVPTFNTDAEATRRAMDRIESLLELSQAQLWIEHDLAFHESLELAPAWYQ